MLCQSAALWRNTVQSHIQSACLSLQTHICAEVTGHNQLMQFVNRTHVWLLTVDDGLQHPQHTTHRCLACAKTASALQVMLFAGTNMLTQWLMIRCVTH